MSDYTIQNDLVYGNIPQLFDFRLAPLSILYIGANLKDISFATELKDTGHELTLLELHKRFALRYTKEKYESEVFDSIIVGDVRNLDPLKVLRGEWSATFDAVFWWHGPEHIYMHEVAPAVASLESITKRLIVLACPWGDTKLNRDVDDGRIPGQLHLSKLYPKNFIDMGYEVRTTGVADAYINAPGVTSHILAWRWL